MAARTWRHMLYRFVFPDGRRLHQIPRLIPSQTHWKVYKLNTKINRSRNRVNIIYFLKQLSRLTLFENLKLQQPGRFFRPLTNLMKMNEEIVDASFFQPPKSVCGMKELDRTAFKQIVKIPAIKVPVKQVAFLNKHFKKSLCKFARVRPIAELSDDDPEKDDLRLFLLKPQKYTSVDSFDERECNLLEQVGVKLPSAFIWTDIELGYDNWNASEILRAIIPGESDNVTGFSNIGHIAHLNLREDVSEFKYIIGEVLLDKVSNLKTVVNKVNVIDNTFRNFEMELLAGEKDFFATVRENKCTYQFDFDKVYWNSRLGREHESIIGKLTRGDFVFDVFAGVGPFALPAAKKGCQVFANDLNPHSFKWLTHNKTLNKVTTPFEAFNLDGREFIRSKLKPFLSSRWQEFVTDVNLNDKNIRTDCKFHIIMNLPALAVDFLDTFPSLFDDIPEVLAELDTCHLPRVYCYCFYKGDNPDEDIRDRVLKVLNTDTDAHLKDFEIRFVRNVAPNKDMYCVQFVMPAVILCRTKLISTTEKESQQSSIAGNLPEAKKRRIDTEAEVS